MNRFTYFLKQLYEPVKESGRLSALDELGVSISVREGDARDQNGLAQNLVGTRVLIQLFNSLESLNYLSKSSEALSIGLTPAAKIKFRFVAHANEEAAV